MTDVFKGGVLVKHCISLSAVFAMSMSANAETVSIGNTDLTPFPVNIGELVMEPNDDGSSGQLNLPFSIKFFGSVYDSFFVNNNGNITFNRPLGAFTPEPFPNSELPMIAPFWGDVDTRCDTCGGVYLSSPSPSEVMVTWDSVGYYSVNSSKTNTFQVSLIDRSDTGDGNFDVQFRYDQLEWTTGDASEGEDGLGGTPAQAGYDAGDGVNFFTLPGSRTSEVLDLATTSNIGVPGEWLFSIREGELPGSTPDNPLMPIPGDDGWEFDFSIIDPNDMIFIDPEYAIGYDYIVDSGPNFQSVELPTNVGDGVYDLWLFDTNLQEFTDTGTDIFGGQAYDFASGGVDSFRIMGIEIDAMLDPDDPNAFVTGLTFTNSGPMSMRQVPITASVPEPGILLLFGLGFSGLLLFGMRRAID